MSRQVKEYEVVKEFQDIAARLVDMYPDILDGVDYESIQCYAVTNKNKEPKDKHWEVNAVKMPIRMDCPYGWYATIWADAWHEMNDARRHLLVFQILYACGDEEGKVRTLDYKDFDILVSTAKIGPHSLEKSDLPDILSERMEFNL